jgi:hypothetical protein
MKRSGQEVDLLELGEVGARRNLAGATSAKRCRSWGTRCAAAGRALGPARCEAGGIGSSVGPVLAGGHCSVAILNA